MGAMLCLSGMALTACNGAAGSNASGADPHATAASAKAPKKTDFYLMRMGNGYDNTSHTVTSGQTCIANASNPDNIYIGNPSAAITFDHQQDMTALQNALNVNVTGGLGGDRFGGSISAQFAQASKTNAYTTNLVYLYKYAGKAVFRDGTLGHGLAALTPYAAELEQSSPTKFRKMCGNRFIEQMDAGSLLAVRLSLNFNSHMEQQQFASKLEADVTLANISLAIQQAASSSKVHVTMTLSAIQLGGQPEKLNDVFGHPDANGNYPFIRCEGNESAACSLMVSNIIAYAQTMKNQLDGSSGGLNLDRLYYTNPTVTEYANLGIPTQGAPDPSAEILAAMEQLTRQYDKAVYDYTFVSHYINTLSNKLDVPTRENLRDAAQRLNNQVNNVYLLPVYDVADCYKGYVSTQCLEIRDNVQNALHNYQLTSVQSNLIEYLENNSYKTYVLNYYGNESPNAVDYRISDSECILAPVSNPTAARYALNCGGKWLTTANSKGVNLLPGFGGSGLSIKDMAYTSTTPYSTNGQLIRYSDILIPVNPGDERYFDIDNIEVTAPSLSTNLPLELMRLFENQA